jgi:cation-transporting ATPase I
MTGSAGRARTVGLAALVGSQLGQTLVVGRPQPATVAALVGSAGALVAVVQIPGLSQLFGCQPLGPAGWTIAGVAAGMSTAASVVVPRLGSRIGQEGPEIVIDLRPPATVEPKPANSSA